MSRAPYVCLVNLTQLDLLQNGGVGRIAAEVSRLLIDQSGDQLRPVFLVRWGEIPRFRAWAGRPVVVVPSFTSVDARRSANAIRPDLIVSPLFGMSPLARVPFPVITQIPDTLVFDHPELFERRARMGRMRVYDALPSAERVVTISQFSRDQLLRHTAVKPDRISVIGLGSDFGVDDAEAGPPGLPDRYVIYPAHRWPHKRHDLAVRVMEQVWSRDPGLTLLLPGSPDSDGISGLSGGLREPGSNRERIVYPGHFTDAQLRIAYRRAYALLFVSEYEGFGLPVIEAMAAGCPVLCSPAGALPEVAGDAALYVDGDNPDSWATALLDQLPRERTERITRGYAQAAKWTWLACREEWSRILESLGVPMGGNGEPAVHPVTSALLDQLENVRVSLDVDWHSDRAVFRSGARLLFRPSASLRAWQVRTKLLRLALA